MKLTFEKYHGAGNDFILVDNRQHHFPKEATLIAKLCDRRLGIGADGLILIERHPDFDFEMHYYNADGGLGSMCGNGGRCAVIFAKETGHFSQSTATFMAIDGIHTATIINHSLVKISMTPVTKISKAGSDYVLDTGSPHYVRFTKNVDDVDVLAEGKKIRYGSTYREKGINVNFATLSGDECSMRTYERGVENETLSCGTGTVAVAIAASLQLKNETVNQEYLVAAPGGKLKVYFTKESPEHFTNLFLEGPVQKVFQGQLEI
ncbi:MAG: diaminopimelate epimerase [Chitinophagaceae bacterium]|nr:diaminopimelate epimerase [Chitinophagaceae bacterium]